MQQENGNTQLFKVDLEKIMMYVRSSLPYMKH